MRKEIITCDRCGAEMKHGTTNTYIRVEGNGCALTAPVNNKDFCDPCLSLIFEAITDTARRIENASS